MTNAFTVSEILARGVFIEWPEGVALVREMAQRLSGDSEPSSLPDLDQIAVSPAGGIVVLGRTAVDDPVRRFGQLLQAVLSQSEPPVQLRLLMSQATAPEPVFSSIREYDRALEFFDRPNRSVVLQGLFARAAAAPPPAERVKPARVEAIAPVPASVASPPPREKAPGGRRTVRLVAVAVAFAGACGAGVWYGRAAGVLPDSQLVKDTALEVSDTLGSAITTGLSVVSEQVGLGRLVYGNEMSPAAPAALEAGTTQERPRASRTAPPVPGVVGVTLLDLDAVALVNAAAVLPPTSWFGVHPVEAEPTLADDPGTYSLESTGVSPPVGLRPQLPRELPVGAEREAMGRIELIILPDGTVESARLIGPPRSVVDSMLVSAAKAWEFQPAMKDGRPVRYRQTVWVASH
jgi:hypothetical protein